MPFSVTFIKQFALNHSFAINQKRAGMRDSFHAGTDGSLVEDSVCFNHGAILIRQERKGDLCFFPESVQGFGGIVAHALDNGLNR